MEQLPTELLGEVIDFLNGCEIIQLLLLSSTMYERAEDITKYFCWKILQAKTLPNQFSSWKEYAKFITSPLQNILPPKTKDLLTESKQFIEPAIYYFGIMTQPLICVLGSSCSGKTVLCSALSQLNKSSSPNSSGKYQLQLESGVAILSDVKASRLTHTQFWSSDQYTCDAIIYVVDTSIDGSYESDNEFFENLTRLDSILHIPILVIGTKIDIPHISRFELARSLGVLRISHRPLGIMMVSSISGEGLLSVMDWLEIHVNKLKYT